MTRPVEQPAEKRGGDENSALVALVELVPSFRMFFHAKLAKWGAKARLSLALTALTALGAG